MENRRNSRIPNKQESESALPRRKNSYCKDFPGNKNQSKLYDRSDSGKSRVQSTGDIRDIKNIWHVNII